jgi:signal transduction histidine kinase
MPERRLPGSIELAAYLLNAEALTDVAKHAHASRQTDRGPAER